MIKKLLLLAVFSGAAFAAEIPIKQTNGSPQYKPVSGDITLSISGVTAIGNNKVTGAMIALGSDAAGDIMYYNGTDYVRLAKGSDGQVLKLTSGLPAWGTDNTSGSPTWDTLGDAAADGSVAFADTTQDITANTNDVTAIAQDVLRITLTNDAGTDVLTQRVLVLRNASATGGTTEALLALENADNSAVTSGITIAGTSTGAITTAIDVSDAEIGTAIAIGSNDVTVGGVTISAPEFALLDGTTGGLITSASTLGNDNRLLRSDGTGRAIQASGITLDDSDVLSGGSWSAPTFSGIVNIGDGARRVTASAMGALAIDVTKIYNTKSISADSVVTFSGTPANNPVWFGVVIKNTDTASHTVTWPSSFSMDRQTTAAHVTTIPASGRIDVQIRYDGTDYTLYGDAATIADLTTATPDITADYFQFYDATDGLHKKALLNATGLISDTAYSSAFNGVTTIAPSKNAVYDQLHLGDTDDDGKIDVLDIISAAGFGAFTSGGVPVQGRTLTEGLAIDITNPTGAAGDPTFAFDPTELTGSRTWGDASTDTIVWTWDRQTGTDVTMTIGSALVTWNAAMSLGTSNAFTAGSIELGAASDTTIARVGAGQISVEGVNVVTTSSTDTLTNKTYDTGGTGNVFKAKGYIYLTHPHLADGTGATIGTTATAIGYGHATFSNSADKAGNYVEYFLQVPEDLDTGVDLRVRIKQLLGNTDTGKQAYELTSVSVADSAVPGSATLANAVAVNFGGDASGANGDVETSAWTTATGWRSALTAGQTWRIRLARDGDDGTNDTSTVNSTELGLVIEYGITQ